MIERLSFHGPAAVSELARPLPLSLPAAMQHLGVLESAGLVRTKKTGRVRTCAIDVQALGLIEQWINARRIEWEQRLDRLGDYPENNLESEGEGEMAIRQLKRVATVPVPQTLRPLKISRVIPARRSNDRVPRVEFCRPRETLVLSGNLHNPSRQSRNERRRCIRRLHALACRRGALRLHGRFVEIVPEARLVIDMRIDDSAGNAVVPRLY